jgi:D-alanine-D-alanine ligase
MKNILIIFGGKSGEHEVSVRSARSIEENIDKTKYKTTVMGITHKGEWHLGSSIKEITDGRKVIAADSQVALPKNDREKSLTINSLGTSKKITPDIVFPIIHGTNGEDGTLQGMLELTNIPYVGPEVLGSASSMDKVVQKQLCEAIGIPQAEYFYLSAHEWQKNNSSLIDEIQRKLKFPLFIKPANMGSSVGISKVKTKNELIAAIEEALKYDQKVIVEEGIEDALEIEVSVLGNHDPKTSVCGSIKPNTEFYDYETKYITDDIVAEIPAKIPETISQKIRQLAIDTFKVMNCFGMARVDFLYQPKTKKYFLNELNTLPGFTSISMYPKLWEATGVSYTKLITRLIELAEERWKEKQQLSYKYQP